MPGRSRRTTAAIRGTGGNVKNFQSKKKAYTSQISLNPPPSNMLGTLPSQEAKKKKMRKNIRKRGMLIFLHPRSVRAKKNSQDP